MPTFGSSCKHCGEVFRKGKKSLSAMRRFAEGSPLGVSARSTSSHHAKGDTHRASPFVCGRGN